MIEVLIPFLFMKMHTGDHASEPQESGAAPKTPGRAPFQADFMSPIEKVGGSSYKRRDVSPLGQLALEREERP